MPYQPQPPMDANNTPGLAPRAQLPQNIEAEQSVLAACLLNGEVTEEAVMRLRPENFFRSGPFASSSRPSSVSRTATFPLTPSLSPTP